MRYRKLTSDITVSEIGLGCWAMGGLNWENGGYDSGWAPPNENDILEAVAYGIDCGITHFDTADVYGNGHAERLLAKSLGTKNKNVIVTSKVGWFKGCASHGYEPSHIQHQCEQSLINLHRDTIDIYYFHHSNFGKNDCYLDDALEVMIRLKEAGKIRSIGLSAYSHKAFTRLIPRIQPDVIQGCANILDDRLIMKNSPTVNACKKYDVSFIGFSPLAQGLLLNKYSSKNMPIFPAGDHRRNSSKFSVDRVKVIEGALQKLSCRYSLSKESLARIALQYILYNDFIGGVLTGFRDKKQVQSNLDLTLNNPLNGEDVAFIRKCFQ